MWTKGCYVDGVRGIYATDAIVGLARTYGADIEHDLACLRDHAVTCDESEFAGCEFAADYEDEATAYMEHVFPIAGAYWGRNYNGDWGLWDCE